MEKQKLMDQVKSAESPAPEPKDLIAPPDFVPHWDESVTDTQYHADRTSAGSTQVRQVLDSPAAFHEEYYGDGAADEEDEDEPKHFSEGRLIHMCILEPEKFRSTYIVEPEFWGLTKDGKNSQQSAAAKEKKAMWYADLAPGTQVCTEKQLKMVTKIAQAIMKHPQGPDLLKDCKPEVAGYYRDPFTGIKCRFKPDLLRTDFTSLVDLKSAKSSHSVFFGSQAFSHRYDIQLFMYREGVRAITGKDPTLLTSMVVEKNKAIEPAIYFWTPEDLIQAECDYRAGLRKLKQCIDDNIWPFRQQMIERIRTPQWFISRSVEEANI